MTTAMKKRTPAAAGGGAGIAGLMERRQQAAEKARQHWRELVTTAAAGVELDSDQVEQLGKVADLLVIGDIERSFNDDVDAWRWVQQVEADIERIKAKDWPTELQRLADEITRLEEQRRRLIHQRTEGRVLLESIGPMTREIGERQQKHPRIFPVTN